MDQQQQELRQAAAQAFMESLDLLEDCLHTAESTPDLISQPTPDAIAPSPIAAKVASRPQPSSIERSASSNRPTNSQAADGIEAAIDARNRTNQPSQSAIEAKIDLQALEEAVADIEQFMNFGDSE